MIEWQQKLLALRLYKQLIGEIELVVLDQRFADAEALRLLERVSHRAADEDGVRHL